MYHEYFYIEEDYADGTPQNWWCEDERDKVVILLVSFRGNGSNEIKQHRIHLSHYYPHRSYSTIFYGMCNSQCSCMHASSEPIDDQE